jgi:glycoside/pentoside/hexuronide:cation symporter, GPH family
MAGIGLGAIQLLTWAMIPDAVEWDELQTGKRHEGMFYSLVTTFRKVAVSLSIPLVLLMLEWTGYVANAEVQPHNAILGLQLLIGPIPAVCLVFGIVLAAFYPLNRARHAELRAKLAERQAQEKQ